MTTGTLILLSLQGLLFAVWGFLMFRTLFLLKRRARRDTGAALPGPLSALAQWRIFLTSREDRKARLLLGLVTLLLTGVSVVFALRA